MSCLSKLTHISSSQSKNVMLISSQIPSLSVLVNKLKFLYASPQQSNIAEECINITILLLMHSGCNKKFNIKDILFNNLILAWNIRHYPMLKKFICLVSRIDVPYELNEVINYLSIEECVPCIDLLRTRSVQMQKLIEKAVILSCKITQEERIYHHYLRQAKVLNHQKIYEEALLSYLNYLKQDQAFVPTLDLTTILIHALQILSFAQIQPIIIIYCHLFPKPYLTDSINALFQALCTWTELHSQNTLLHIFVYCILQHSFLSYLCLNPTSSLSTHTSKIQFILKCILTVNAITVNVPQHIFIALQSMIQLNIKQLTNCDFLIFQLINSLQKIKNKWQGDTKWKYIARIQILLLKLESKKVELMVYMSSNIQILFNIVWKTALKSHQQKQQEQTKQIFRIQNVQIEHQTSYVNVKTQNDSSNQQQQTISLIGSCFNTHPKNIEAWMQIVTKVFSRFSHRHSEKWFNVLFTYQNIAYLNLTQICRHLSYCLKGIMNNNKANVNTKLPFILLNNFVQKISFNDSVQNLCGRIILLYAKTIKSCNKAHVILKNDESEKQLLICESINQIIKKCSRNRFIIIEPIEKELFKQNPVNFQSLLHWYAQLNMNASTVETLSFLSCIFWLKKQSKPQFQDMILHYEQKVLKMNTLKYINSIKQASSQIQTLVSVWIKELFFIANRLNIVKQEINYDEEVQESGAILLKIKKYLMNLEIKEKKINVNGLSLYAVKCENINAILQIQCLIDLADKADLKIMEELICLQCSFIYALNKNEMELIELQLAKHYFLKRILNTKILGEVVKKGKQNSDTNLYKKVLMGDDIDTQLQEGGLLESKYFKALYLISKRCFMSKSSVLLSYFAAYVWTRGVNLKQQMIRRDQILVSCAHPQRRKRQSLTDCIVGIEFSCDQMLSLLLQLQIQYSFHLNLLSQLRSLMSFATIYFLRSGAFKNLLLLWKVYQIKQQNVFHVLPVIDTLKNMIAENIDKDLFQKAQKHIYKNRKSLTNNINLSKVSTLLQQSLQHCGVYGKILSNIFLLHCEHQFSFKKHKVYCEQSKINTKIKQNQIKNRSFFFYKQTIEKQDACVNVENTESQFFNFCQFQFDKQNMNVIQAIHHIEKCLNKLQTHVYINMEQSQILRSYLGEFFDFFLTVSNKDLSQKVDNFLIKIFVIFEEQSYQIKQKQQNSIQLHLHSKWRELYQAVKQRKKQNEMFISLQQKNVSEKMKFLMESKCVISLMFGLGEKLINVAMCLGVVVSSVDLGVFRDNARMLSMLVAKNKSLLGRKSVSHSEWWATRVRTNREMGKILSIIDVGVCDAQCSSIREDDYLVQSIQCVDPLLLKFLDSPSHHLQQYIHRMKYLNFQSILNNLHTIQSLGGLRDMKYNKDKQQTNIMLCIAQEFANFPFEGCKEIQKYQGKYRIPSIKYLMQQKKTECWLDLNAVQYVVNSHNDLPETEAVLRKMKEKYSKWEGVIGRNVTLAELQRMLSAEGIYLYMGHGTGTTHIQEQELAKIKVRAMAMLFGCSSANMIDANCELHGVAYNLLLKGCPSLLGCLWDVTDKDIDKLTQQLFDTYSTINLSALLESSKLKCKLPFLNGSAVVLYGLPTYLTFH